MRFFCEAHSTVELFAPPDGRDGRIFTSGARRFCDTRSRRRVAAPAVRRSGNGVARRRRQRRPARSAATRASAARGVALQGAEGIVRSYDGRHAEASDASDLNDARRGRASSKAVDACVAEGSSPPPEPFDLRRRTRAAVDSCRAWASVAAAGMRTACRRCRLLFQLLCTQVQRPVHSGSNNTLRSARGSWRRA